MIYVLDQRRSLATTAEFPCVETAPVTMPVDVLADIMRLSLLDKTEHGELTLGVLSIPTGYPKDIATIVKSQSVWNASQVVIVAMLLKPWKT